MEKIFKRVIKNRLEYSEAIEWFAFTKFVIEGKSEDGFAKWLRVVRNLAENFDYDYAGQFANAIKTLSAMECENIYEYLSDETVSSKGFSSEQIEEEQLKAKVILKKSEWETKFIASENHPHFNGQISFLINFSKLDTENVNDSSVKKRFDEYLNKAALIFSHNGISEEIKNYSWERALLSKGNYLLQVGRNHSFCFGNHRDVGWKRLLKDKDRREYVKQILDEIKGHVIEKELQKIIDDFNVADWRKYFVKRIGLIEQCGSLKFIRIGDETGNNILLLTKSTTSGFHYEYYSYALKVRLEQDGNVVTYVPERSREYIKYISSINNKKIAIYYDNNDSNIWKYWVEFDEENKISFDSEDSVIEYLKEQNYLLS